jgi:uncharacterized membrane protein (UPF0182 family)
MTTAPQSTSRTWASLGVLALLALFLGGVLLQVGVGLWIDASWFAHLGYGQVWLLNRAAPWGLGLIVFSAVALWLGLNLRVAWPYPKRPWRALVVILSSGYVASVAMAHWFTFLVALFQQRVESPDPVLHHDISFYLFSLPLLLQLQRWGFWGWAIDPGAGGPVLWAAATPPHTRIPAAAIAAGAATSVGTGRHPSAAGSGLRALAGAVHLDVFQSRVVCRGELHRCACANACGCVFDDGWRLSARSPSFTSPCSLPGLAYLKTDRDHQAYWFWYPQRGLILLVILGGYGLAAIGFGILYPQLVQRVAVVPNELERDRPYIEHNIAFSRQAYNLAEVDVQPFQVKDNLTPESLTRNTATLKNIRLWDNEPLLAAYRQLQEIRPYYQFPSVDVDRYTIDGDLRQVMHSARELDYDLIPERARTWVNDHFFYTHGYGLALSPVNVVTRVGLPDFFIQDIPPRATSPAAAEAFPIQIPPSTSGNSQTWMCL